MEEKATQKAILTLVASLLLDKDIRYDLESEAFLHIIKDQRLIWNPFEDSRQAFDLMVDLGMAVVVDHINHMVTAICGDERIMTEMQGDAAAAVRGAIVFAAAVKADKEQSATVQH